MPPKDLPSQQRDRWPIAWLEQRAVRRTRRQHGHPEGIRSETRFVLSAVLNSNQEPRLTSASKGSAGLNSEILYRHPLVFLWGAGKQRELLDEGVSRIKGLID